MEAIELIVFDCDGVLVDSEVLSCGCLCEVLDQYGIALSVAQALHLFLGRSTSAVIEYCRAAGQVLPESFPVDLSRRIRESFRRDLKPIGGIEPVLSKLTQPHCVASSSDLDRVSFSLELVGLAGYFGDRLYTSQMVSRGKPAPDLFLHAAGSMGCEPGRVLVIEDSVSGVEAARAAGMRVWGFVGGSHYRSRDDIARLEAAGVDRIFHRMSDFWAEG